MFYTLAIAIVILAAVLGFAATKPSTFRLQRSQSIPAPPETVFALIQDLREWRAWSPFEKLDPAMQRTYSGAASGKGAIYEWAGNRKAGEGRMEIIDTNAFSKILIKLDFLKPFEGHNVAEFSLEAMGDSTNVTWAMYGPRSYVAKILTTFIDCDSMVGKQFEEGLAKLKSVAEKQTAAQLTR